MLVLVAELVSVFGPTFSQKVVPELAVGFAALFSKVLLVQPFPKRLCFGPTFF